ncbi:hypothetical protein [Paenibacillus alvei]|uniref:hypothetical protein n=1 Tax=Paenibacillus alvei TaxID=44250 RepID=UPI00227E8942|nr:hypothetical protein [Paenibacillus alvei]
MMLQVMLADQDVIERRQAVEMVEEGGYTVVGQAGSQPEAWEQVEKLWPEVVIADTSGNGIDGSYTEVEGTSIEPPSQGL